MKIAIIAHSCNSGGAENALRMLVNRLKNDNELVIYFPSLNGDEPKYYKKENFKIHALGTKFALPSLSSVLYEMGARDWSRILAHFSSESFDLIISNTMATLDGQFLSNYLNIPHVCYVHEFLDNFELRPNCTSIQNYIDMIGEGASGLIFCSEFSKDQFNHLEKRKIVLPPYDFGKKSEVLKPIDESNLIIQIIANQSDRKNIGFAINVANSLATLGIAIRLDIIGRKHNASSRIQKLLNKRKINVRQIDFMENPYEINAGKKVITLSCSTTEPYGLTIIESLQRSIPVISSNSGGPEEILPTDMLFNVDDFHECAQKIKFIFDNYDIYSAKSSSIYDEMHCNSQIAFEKLNQFLYEAKNAPPSKFSMLDKYIKLAKEIFENRIPTKQLLANTYRVMKEEGVKISPEDFLSEFKKETQIGGYLVNKDIKHFGVTPFAYSNEMDSLYKYGFGLAMELIAHHLSAARTAMLSFIVYKLNSYFNFSKNIRILALGDGLGAYSFCLAKNGYKVDYMDYDNSNMAKIAQLNLSNLIDGGSVRIINSLDQEYDVIVCLEVIEHVPDPIEFIEMLSKHTKMNGLLFISDCFNGVNSQWPTHLYANEKYSGALPLMLLQDFSLEAFNTSPFFKPYAFKKDLVGFGQRLKRTINDVQLMDYFLRNQSSLY